MILYNILIFTFGFWNVFKKNKSLSPILGFSFIVALSFSIFSIFGNSLSIEEKAAEGVILLMGLSILGFILIALSNNKLAQIGAVFLAAMGVNLYISNPHTPIDPSVELDASSELLIRLDHNNKVVAEKDIKQLHFVEGIQHLLNPAKSEITELDDYIKVNIKEGVNIDIAIGEISQFEGVEWIEPNEILKLDTKENETMKTSVDFMKYVNDPMANRQWNMEVLDMGSYYSLFENRKYKPKKTAKLFILDSGVNPKHEDIGKNFYRHKSNDTEANESDGNGHGTHCAGVAGAILNNGKGIASMNPGSNWVTVSSVKVMNNFGYGSQARIIEGIIEAVDAGADVISMSLGGRSSQIKEEAYEEAMAYAESQNVIIIAAAGNNAGDAAKITPANSPIVITVTALDRDLKKAQFSNYITNTNYGIAAPGTSIMSPWKGGRYAALDGTSMAAPHVSGLVAVMRSLNPSLTTKQAFDILNKTGKDTKDTRLTGRMIQPMKAIIATAK